MSEAARATRDVLFGSEDRAFVLNDFVQDLIRLHRIIYLVQDKADPQKEADVTDVVEHVYKFIAQGKGYHFAGVRNVPTPFLTSPGRFMQVQDGTQSELSEDDAKAKLATMVLEAFGQPLEGVDEKESPYKEYQEILARYPEGGQAAEPIVPSAKDAILIDANDTHGVADRIQEHELGNKVVFNVASQVVTSYTASPDKRVEAALTILHSLDDAQVMVSNPLTPEGAEAELPPPTQKARFLIRNITTDERSSWSLMDGLTASFLVLAFCYEVYLEKGIHVTDMPTNHTEVPAMAHGPIDNPTDFDVLFGRGGATNQWQGNKRFRDVIALHRPDYIRAIKMDKPAVARKIVRSIRHGDPPGRFLKKHDDGKWYDVGDRTAAEKTSQGLRERSNAEKRQRHALREALRIRKQDMTDGDEESGKRTATVAPAPLPILNYVGTNLAVPLSLGMKEPPRNTVKRRKTENGAVSDELNTEGLPPNAVDEDGNILVTDYDILCGRGGGTNHHRGNKRFRDIVALHRPDYVRAPKIQKPSVARVIVRAIRNGDPPGRFLRKDEKSGKWIDVGDKKAAEKTSQALREKTNEEREKIRKDPSVAATATNLLPGTDFLATAGAIMAGIPAAAAAAVAQTKEEAKDDKKVAAKADDVKKESVSDPVNDPTADMPPAEKSTEEMAAEAETVEEI